MEANPKGNQYKKHKARNRNKRSSSQYSSFAPVPLLKLPNYQIPVELLNIFKNQLHRYPGINSVGELWLNFISLLSWATDVQEENYLIILKLLLYMEEYYYNDDMKKFNLYRQRIRRAQYTSGQYIIRVPGLSEDRPSLMPNDIVEIYTDNPRRKYNLTVTHVGMSYVIARPENTAFHNFYREDAQYDVKFKWPNWTVRVCHYAIDLVRQCQLTPIFYPAVRKIHRKPKTDLDWIDKHINTNPEQMQAVQRIVGQTAYPSPYLLFGPPGTGKTSTIVEAISQIYTCDPSNRILVCTPSNAAADEITKRLVKNIPLNIILRMYSPSRDSRDVDESINDCTNFIDNEVLFLPLDVLRMRKVVITTLLTCVRLLPMELSESHFQYIFIDEAGQATQPESLIPIGLSSSDDLGHIGKIQAQIVLSGDPQQLGPVTKSKFGKNFLGKSMLERLMESFEIYRKNSEGKYNPNFITKLVNNYRSHEAILRIPNELFYDNELRVCGGKSIFRAENWSELPNKKFPIIFHATHGLEKQDENSPSVCNELEVEIVMSYINKLLGKSLGDGQVSQKDIGIVTPFRLQRTVLLKALEKKGWNNIAVGTVEVFQGQEKDVIILSSVRSTVFQHDGRFHIGFLSNEKRFNVAITRAKSLLIMVGNPNVLQLDNCWKRIIEYCRDNGAFVGDEFTLHDMSKNECKKLLNNRDSLKYFETETDELPVPEEEILQCRVNPLPENNFPRRKFRVPKIYTNVEQSSSALASGTLEADSGTYSSSNDSVTIEEQLDVSTELMINSRTAMEAKKILEDADTSLSYSDFSSEEGDNVVELTKTVKKLDLKAD